MVFWAAGRKRADYANQRERQTDRQRQTETERQTDRQTDRERCNV